MNLLEQATQPQPEYNLIPLSRGLFAKADNEDAAPLLAHKWYAKWCTTSRSFYAARNVYNPATGKQDTLLMHRQIMKAGKGILVDHKEHDTLDNRKGNLRLASRKDNNRNARVRADNKFALKGVMRKPRCVRYNAYIRDSSGRQIRLGLFDTAAEAHEAYKAAAVKLHGEFACFG